MPKAGPATVADLIILRYSVLEPPKPIAEVIVDIAVAEGWYETSDLAAEGTFSWIDRVVGRLNLARQDAARFGRPVRYAFNSVSEYLLQGSAYAELTDSVEVAEMKRLRGSASTYSDMLLGVSPSQFERVCRGVLRVLGCADPYLTPFSADQGIDFFGRLHLQGRLGNADLLGSIDQAISMWVVGQAKHYSATHVATPHIRELVGAVELARTRTYASSGKGLDKLEIAALDPVLYLFITTGRISSDAWNLIDRSGMVAMDGDTVAVFLAENGVGLVDGVLDAEAFFEWIGPTV